MAEASDKYREMGTGATVTEIILGEALLPITHPSQSQELPRSDWLWQPIEWGWSDITQSVLSSCGIVGNMLVIMVLFQRRAARISTDTLIGALAVADFLTSLLIFPQPKPVRVPLTFLGHAACKIVRSAVFMWISINASVFTLTAISVERYIAIVHPLHFKRWMTPRRTVVLILMIWLLSLGLKCRSFAVTVVDATSGRCIVTYPSPESRTYFAFQELVTMFLIPIATMLVTQCLIARSLRRDVRRFDADLQSSGPSAKLLLARKKVITLVLIVVLIFVICWTPDGIAYMALGLQLVGPDFLFSTPYNLFVNIAFFNSCVNPMVYLIRYPQFRVALKELFSRRSTEMIKAPVFGQDERQFQ
ncbi:allatostatin-A receptor-like [Diadema setosum]|uniref:allatostatin-A receptor-like n=1 Tax=Diadema setosum TaxID=31175 RepID=UPI003B3BB2F3